MKQLLFRENSILSRKASYTIEASLLFPFILAVIVLTIYGAFYIHDRAVLNAAANQASIRGAELTSPHADVMEKVRHCGEEAMKGRLLSTKQVQTEIRITRNQISVHYSGDFVLPAGAVPVPGLRLDLVRVEAEGHCQRLDPTGFVRECRILENLKK